MIRVYYMAEGDPDAGGGGGDPKKKDSAKVNTTANQRRDWNDFLDHLQKEGVAGSKELDQLDKNAVKPYLDQYRKDNPNTSVSEEMIPIVQREHEELRKGDSFADMSPEQTRVMRKQLNDSYTSRIIASQGMPFNSTLSRQYYPTFRKGDKDYGTDAEAYMKDFATPKPKPGDGPIPLPNYNDTTSRQGYLKQWAKKYGDLQGRGDTVLKVNETPRGGSGSAKQVSTKVAKEYGLDPSLLYSSAMEEGMSELFKDKSGLDTKHRKPGDFGYMGDYGDKEYPINGANSLGLPDFANRFHELVEGGYLPKDFSNKFRGKAKSGEFGENNFKTLDDALKAKAALMKYGEDYVDKLAKKDGVTLSAKQKDFFTLAWFNGGEGAVLKRIPEYAKKGYLKDDKFIDKRPAEEEGKPDNLDVYGHVTRRIKMASALKEQKLFDDGDTHQDN